MGVISIRTLLSRFFNVPFLVMNLLPLLLLVLALWFCERAEAGVRCGEPWYA